MEGIAVAMAGYRRGRGFGGGPRAADMKTKERVQMLKVGKLNQSRRQTPGHSSLAPLAPSP